MAAAFARLCVETRLKDINTQMNLMQPPSRGCVLKQTHKYFKVKLGQAAAFARLCVETAGLKERDVGRPSSRLRAAVC